MSLSKKLKNFGIATSIVASSFLPMKSLAQEFANTTNKNNTETIQDDWNFSSYIFFLQPHDSDFKDWFGSYFAIQGEAKRKMKEDIYLNANATIGFGKDNLENISINSTLVKIATMFEYQIGTNENSKVAVGVGPEISKLSINWASSGSGTNQSGNLDYSGLGYILQMQYTQNISDLFDLIISGSYSKVKDEDTNVNIGTTGIAVGLIF
ncbi:hypothetical protein KAI04_01045 [Candidatus Pacearchaeota archaeon]|nr:hypothetical protein [Candidatus Pacearchaeota archaeon]